MENQQMENLKAQAKDFAKQQGQNASAYIINCLKKTFSFAGRASRAEFWTFFIALILFNIIEATILALLANYVFQETIMAVLSICCMILNLFLTISLISVSVRRLHDLGLTGFWMWYLSPLGLPIIFVVNLLDLDESCNKVLERIAKVCNNWAAWLLLPVFWSLGAPISALLLFLYPGKKEENMFGPSPYAQIQ